METETETVNETENIIENEKKIIPEMLLIWCKTNKHYTKNVESDYPALRTILQFLLSVSGENDFSANQAKFLNTFQLIADFVYQDDFWRDKSLTSVSKHIQEFYNKLKSGKNGKSVKKTLSQSTYEVFDKYYNKK